jgi:hypothetical protein
MHAEGRVRRGRAANKPVKIIPVHSHPPGMFGFGCRLCETHGDILCEELPDIGFGQLYIPASFSYTVSREGLDFDNPFSSEIK